MRFLDPTGETIHLKVFLFSSLKKARNYCAKYSVVYFISNDCIKFKLFQCYSRFPAFHSRARKSTRDQGSFVTKYLVRHI